jgi:hypothetical protein
VVAVADVEHAVVVRFDRGIEPGHAGCLLNL